MVDVIYRRIFSCGSRPNSVFVLTVGPLVTNVYFVPIKMPFRTVERRKHVLDRVQLPSQGKGHIFGGNGRRDVTYRRRGFSQITLDFWKFLFFLIPVARQRQGNCCGSMSRRCQLSIQVLVFGRTSPIFSGAKNNFTTTPMDIFTSTWCANKNQFSKTDFEPNFQIVSHIYAAFCKFY